MLMSVQIRLSRLNLTVFDLKMGRWDNLGLVWNTVQELHASEQRISRHRPALKSPSSRPAKPMRSAIECDKMSNSPTIRIPRADQKHSTLESFGNERASGPFCRNVEFVSTQIEDQGLEFA